MLNKSLSIDKSNLKSKFDYSQSPLRKLLRGTSEIRFDSMNENCRTEYKIYPVNYYRELNRKNKILKTQPISPSHYTMQKIYSVISNINKSNELRKSSPFNVNHKLSLIEKSPNNVIKNIKIINKSLLNDTYKTFTEKKINTKKSSTTTDYNKFINTNGLNTSISFNKDNIKMTPNIKIKNIRSFTPFVSNKKRLDESSKLYSRNDSVLGGSEINTEGRSRNYIKSDQKLITLKKDRTFNFDNGSDLYGNMISPDSDFIEVSNLHNNTSNNLSIANQSSFFYTSSNIDIPSTSNNLLHYKTSATSSSNLKNSSNSVCEISQPDRKSNRNLPQVLEKNDFTGISFGKKEDNSNYEDNSDKMINKPYIKKNIKHKTNIVKKLSNNSKNNNMNNSINYSYNTELNFSTQSNFSPFKIKSLLNIDQKKMKILESVEKHPGLILDESTELKRIENLDPLELTLANSTKRSRLSNLSMCQSSASKKLDLNLNNNQLSNSKLNEKNNTQVKTNVIDFYTKKARDNIFSKINVKKNIKGTKINNHKNEKNTNGTKVCLSVNKNK